MCRVHVPLLLPWPLDVLLTGWSTRLVMLAKPEMNMFITHQALLIISPVLLAIVEYITLGRLLALTSTPGFNNDPVRAVPVGNNRSSAGSSARRTSSGGAGASSTRLATAVKWCFTFSDIICLLLQSTGGAMYSRPETANLARSLLLVGVGAQLVFFSAFIILTVYVQNSRRFGFRGNKSFRPVFVCLYVTTLLMHLRNAFRVAEFAEGFDGDLAHHEFYLYVFDFMPIYACFIFFAVLHYGWWLGPMAPASKVKMDSKRTQLPVPAVHIQCD